MDGIYSITYRGVADWGMGLLVFQNGIVTGCDVGGILYDGSYEDQGSCVAITLTMTVPPGVALVQGTPARPTVYSFPIEVTVPKNAIDTNEAVLLELPPGPVNAIFRCLRTLEH